MKVEKPGHSHIWFFGKTSGADGLEIDQERQEMIRRVENDEVVGSRYKAGGAFDWLVKTSKA